MQAAVEVQACRGAGPPPAALCGRHISPQQNCSIATALAEAARPLPQLQQRRRQHRCQWPTTVCRSTNRPGGAGAVTAATAAVAAAAGILSADPVAAAAALQVHTEPANALSLPTWAVHTAIVVEWTLAMSLMWRLGEVSGNPRWKGMAWGMLPCQASAMCACTNHFFYNSADVEFLVELQAILTIVGNSTCWWAAYRIYRGAKEGGQQAPP